MRFIVVLGSESPDRNHNQPAPTLLRGFPKSIAKNIILPRLASCWKIVDRSLHFSMICSRIINHTKCIFCLSEVIVRESVVATSKY